MGDESIRRNRTKGFHACPTCTVTSVNRRKLLKNAVESCPNPSIRSSRMSFTPLPAYKSEGRNAGVTAGDRMILSNSNGACVSLGPAKKGETKCGLIVRLQVADRPGHPSIPTRSWSQGTIISAGPHKVTSLHSKSKGILGEVSLFLFSSIFFSPFFSFPFLFFFCGRAKV